MLKIFTCQQTGVRKLYFNTNSTSLRKAISMNLHFYLGQGSLIFAQDKEKCRVPEVIDLTGSDR